MTRNTITETDGKRAQAGIEFDFNDNTPDEVAKLHIEAALEHDNLQFETDLIETQAIILLDTSGSGEEWLATDVLEWDCDQGAECTAILYADGTLKLHSNTVPVKPRYANHTIDELRKKQSEP